MTEDRETLLRRRKAGTRVRRSNNGRARRVKTGGAQWSDEAETLFFDCLGASCNVRWSAEQTGFTTPTVYRQRRMRPDFARRWDEALDNGYARLEMELLRAACDTLEDHPLDDSLPIPKMTVEQAMNVLRAHRNTGAGDDRIGGRRGGKGGPGKPSVCRDFDEVRGSILKKIAAIEQARGKAPLPQVPLPQVPLPQVPLPQVPLPAALE